MRQETNNEMDLLLRRLGRRQDAFASNDDHLDADELSAYAENAVPAKTRTRYTEHLAECSRCRELVVQLNAAGGVVVAEQTTKVLEPSGLKKFLASLLSPMVLRYAAPALGLIVVAVIGFVVMRRNSATEYVSQVQNDQTKPAGELQQLQPSPQTNNSSDRSAGFVDSTNKQDQTKPSPQQSGTPVPQATPADTEVAAPVAKEPAPAKPAESQPAATAAPAAPAAKADSVKDERREKNEDVIRTQESEVKVVPGTVTQRSYEEADNKKAAPEPASERSRAAKNKTVVGGLASAQGAGAPANVQRDRMDRADKDSSSETRSVAGRRFRKQRGIWVDTAYDSSSEPMNLTRGSERYRSLIADEPAIKTIADQLDGEIIVVWKGHQYRIR